MSSTSVHASTRRLGRVTSGVGRQWSRGLGAGGTDTCTLDAASLLLGDTPLARSAVLAAHVSRWYRCPRTPEGGPVEMRS